MMSKKKEKKPSPNPNGAQQPATEENPNGKDLYDNSPAARELFEQAHNETVRKI